MKSSVILSVIVLAVIAGLVYMSMNKPAAPSGQANVASGQGQIKPTETTAAASSQTAPAVNANEVVVTGSSFKFEPASITLKKGEKARIVFKNTEGMHDFVIDEFNVKTKVIKAGTEDTVEFTPDKAGTFEYYCSVGKHRQLGMKGTLTVTE